MIRFIIPYALFVLFSTESFSQQTSLVLAANQFIQGLDKNQQAKALIPFSSEERYNFHFVPRDDRKGISLNELSGKQREAAMNLLKSCLSKEAYEKTNDITQLEIVLKAIEKRPADDHYRDPGKYFISIYGVPANKAAWGWRFEGHHVSFSFSSYNNKLIAGTPGFMGSNPAIVPDGPQKGKQILKEETDMGLALLQSFSTDQLQKVLIDSVAPADIITFDKRTAMIEKPAGLMYADMTVAQQQLMLRLMGLYIHRYTKLFADEMMQQIEKAGLKDLRFAWAGSQQTGIGHLNYYRIQGPTIIIEYDNTQNNGNHVHSVLRDLTNDFGGDELLEHYKNAH